MADNITLNSGSGGATLAADDVSGVYYPIGKVAYGALDSVTLVTTTSGMPVQPQTSSTWAVTDNSGSLTVDAPVGTPVFVRLSDGTSAISTLPVSLASVPSHAVTNAGTFAVQVTGAALTSLQLLDDAVGTVGQGAPVQGVLGLGRDPNSDGFPIPLTVSGAAVIVATDSGALAITDNGGSVTVDAPVATPVFVRLSDGTAAISTLPVSLSSVPSHAVTNAGTFATQETGAALTALQLLDDVVFAEDAGHTTGDKGVPGLAVRNDSDTSLCDTTLDYTPLQVDSNGFLKVNIKAGAGSGGTASTDDGAFTAASGSGTPMMGFVTGDSVDSGDVGVVGMLANRQLKVTLFDSGGSELSVGGGTQYTEDAAAAGNPIGNALIVVRDDSRTGSITSADGDNVALRGTNSGELYVKHTDALTVNSHAVTNAGTFAVQAAQSGTWNVTNVSGTVSLPTGAATESTLSTLNGKVTACNTGAVVISSGTITSLTQFNGNAITTGNGVSGAGVLRVTLASDSTGTVAATQSGTWNVGTVTTLTSLSQFAGNAINVGNGTAGTGTLRVTLASDSTGTVAVTQGTASSLNAQVVGAVAHDGAASGNPVRVGAKAETALSGVTLVADGDATDLYAGVDGVLIVRDHCNLEDIVQERTTNTDGASTAFASGLAAPGSGIRLYVTSADICNSSASFCTVDLRDGSGGSVLWTLPVPATGGVVKTFNPPLKLTANTALAFDPSAATTTITISCNGFKSKV